MSAAAAWRARFAAASANWSRVGRIEILEETASTMDAVRERGLAAGDLAVALRQRAGRGRAGRPWHEAGEGVALTIVVPRDPEASPADAGARMAIGAAVAAAGCLERWLGEGAVGIKWPNDLLVDGRKIGGVLIETVGAFSLLGVGLNALQREFPGGLAPIATSLRQELGEDAPIDRLEVAIELVAALDEALGQPPEDLVARWCRRDALRGRAVRLRVGGETVAGRVREIDPLAWIELEGEHDASPRRLPAALCEVLDFDRGTTR